LISGSLAALKTLYDSSRAGLLMSLEACDRSTGSKRDAQELKKIRLRCGSITSCLYLMAVDDPLVHTKLIFWENGDVGVKSPAAIATWAATLAAIYRSDPTNITLSYNVEDVAICGMEKFCSWPRD